MSLHWLFHSWGKWQVIERFNISNDGKIVGERILQERTCSVCDKTQRAAQSTWI